MNNQNLTTLGSEQQHPNVVVHCHGVRKKIHKRKWMMSPGFPEEIWCPSPVLQDTLLKAVCQCMSLLQDCHGAWAGKILLLSVPPSRRHGCSAQLNQNASKLWLNIDYTEFMSKWAVFTCSSCHLVDKTVSNILLPSRLHFCMLGLYKLFLERKHW